LRSYFLPRGLSEASTRTTVSNATTTVVISRGDLGGLAFSQNLRRGNYQLAVDAGALFRLATAFDELRLAI